MLWLGWVKSFDLAYLATTKQSFLIFSMKNSISSPLRIRSAFSKYVENEVTNPIKEVINIIQEKKEKLSLKIQELKPNIKKSLDIFSDMERQFSQDTKDILACLEKKGWCLDISDLPLDITYKLGEIVESKNDSEIDDFFKSYFLYKLESIEQNLVDNFPHRAKRIQGAFDDHRSGRFYSSIPIFLIEADGICSEVTGYTISNGQSKLGNGLYDKKNKKQKLIQKIRNSKINLLTEAILCHLIEDLSISENTDNFRFFWLCGKRCIIRYSI